MKTKKELTFFKHFLNMNHKYSEDLNNELVWCLNDPKLFDRCMVCYSVHKLSD